MRGEQMPALIKTDLADRLKGSEALPGVHIERRLLEPRFDKLAQLRPRFRQRGTGNVVMTVDCA
jgi:hypothetical protein